VKVYPSEAWPAESTVLDLDGTMDVATGLPFIANDVAMHTLLAEHTVADARRLQIALGQIRRTSGDFSGKLLAIDPHRTRSYSKRQMRRFRDDQKVRAYKVAPTFFALESL